MDMTEPMCLVGSSMGGTIVGVFATKYPEYVSMICLLSPIGMFHTIFEYLSLCNFEIANEGRETDLIRELREGTYNGLLPETRKQLRRTMNTLTATRPKIPKVLLNGFLHLRLRRLEEHKKGIVQKNSFIVISVNFFSTSFTY